MTVAVLALLSLGMALLLVGRLHELLHLLQLEHYEYARLRVWVARRRERAMWSTLGVVLASGALCAAALAVSAPVALGIAGVLAAAAATHTRAAWTRPRVKALKFTARARRLMAVSVSLAVGPLALAAASGAAPPARALGVCAIGIFLHVLAPELLGAGAALLRPIQAADNRRFVQKARRKLTSVAPLVVGITGSYGKTTTKATAAAVMDTLGPSCATPASFNSFLGVVRATNEELREDHRSFIVEMGAYRAGDIAELCDLVHPSIGILTTIGPAHLERFGSLEAIADAKSELPRSLPTSGTFITRADHELCRRAAELAPCRSMFFAVDPHPDAEVWAADVVLDAGATRFALCVREPGGSVRRSAVRSRLLGSHNIANILAGATLGLANGLALEAVAFALARVRPPEHRLSPIVNRGAGLVVIDDAYNANPEGAAAALAVLAAHPAERRILVTPGMVELGSLDERENAALGEAAAEVCDLVILTGGTNSAPVRRGLERAGFPLGAIHEARGSIGAQSVLAEIARRGDVILFENDLPDSYLEVNGEGRASRGS